MLPWRWVLRSACKRCRTSVTPASRFWRPMHGRHRLAGSTQMCFLHVSGRQRLGRANSSPVARSMERDLQFPPLGDCLLHRQACGQQQVLVIVILGVRFHLCSRSARVVVMQPTASRLRCSTRRSVCGCLQQRSGPSRYSSCVARRRTHVEQGLRRQCGLQFRGRHEEVVDVEARPICIVACCLHGMCEESRQLTLACCFVHCLMHTICTMQ